MYIQREDDDTVVEYIEDQTVPIKKNIPIEYTSSNETVSLNETGTSESINCAYRV